MPLKGDSSRKTGKLFDLGYEMAVAGYPWKKVPPGMETTLTGDR